MDHETGFVLKKKSAGDYIPSLLTPYVLVLIAVWYSIFNL